jgi:hypothetical protein
MTSIGETIGGRVTGLTLKRAAGAHFVISSALKDLTGFLENGTAELSQTVGSDRHRFHYLNASTEPDLPENNITWHISTDDHTRPSATALLGQAISWQ